MGDSQEIMAIRKVFGDAAKTYINNTKSFIGHAMGSIGVLELAGNLPSFADNVVHPTINCEDLDPECDMPDLVIGTPKTVERVEYILNNSFGMVGINSVVIVKRLTEPAA
jgi:3-oxoacyl-[acyl-carrier-protein] synthase II